MTRPKISYFCLLVFFSIGIVSLKAQKTIKKADDAYDNAEYFKAIELYKDAYKSAKTKDEKGQIYFKLGVCCKSINNFKEAEKHFKLAVKQRDYINLYNLSELYEIYDELEEAKRPSSNILKIGRVQKIRRRIRRNAKGRIIVQKNIKRSSIKGYRVSGNTIKRIPSAQRILKTRKLKRYWATKGRSKLSRTLLKRKMSLRKRKSMGIR